LKWLWARDIAPPTAVARENPLPKMPKLPLDAHEIKDVAEYVQTLK
jgi:hypothetical protein